MYTYRLSLNIFSRFVQIPGIILRRKFYKLEEYLTCETHVDCEANSQTMMTVPIVF